jgi:hypothetical protein
LFGKWRHLVRIRGTKKAPSSENFPPFLDLFKTLNLVDFKEKPPYQSTRKPSLSTAHKTIEKITHNIPHLFTNQTNQTEESKDLFCSNKNSFHFPKANREILRSFKKIKQK